MKTIELSESGYATGLSMAAVYEQNILDELQLADIPSAQVQTRKAIKDGRIDESDAQILLSWNRQSINNIYRLLFDLRIQAMPSIADVPELKGMDQWWCDWAKGLSDGLGLEYEDALRWLQWREMHGLMLKYSYAEIESWLLFGGVLPLDKYLQSNPVEKCTSFVIAESEDGPLICKCCDDSAIWTKYEAFYDRAPVLYKNSKRGYSFVVGDGFCVNEKGVGISSAGGCRYEELPPFVRFPVETPFSPMLFMMHSSTTEDVVELYKRYSYFLLDNSNVAVIDSHGNTAIIEPVRVDMAFRWGKDGVAYTTTRGVSDKRLREKVINTPQELAYYEGRMKRLEWHLVKRGGKLSHARVREAQSDHHGWTPLCQHRDQLPPKEKLPNGQQRQSIAFETTMHCVVEIKKYRYASYLYENGKYPCQAKPQWYDYSFQR